MSTIMCCSTPANPLGLPFYSLMTTAQPHESNCNQKKKLQGLLPWGKKKAKWKFEAIIHQIFPGVHYENCAPNNCYDTHTHNHGSRVARHSRLPSRLLLKERLKGIAISWNQDWRLYQTVVTSLGHSAPTWVVHNVSGHLLGCDVSRYGNLLSA